MVNLFKKIYFFATNRFVLFGIIFIVFLLTQYLFSGSLFPSTETRDLWFYSGIFMVLFSILFIEPYYTSPKNVITNTIPLLLILLAIKSVFPSVIVWWISIIILLILILGSIISIGAEDSNLSPTHWKNILSTTTKDIVVTVGQGRILYSAAFLYFLLTYYAIQNFHTLILLIIWAAILSINPKYIHNKFALMNKKVSSDQLGEIFGVQSKKMFLVKLYEDRKSIKKFDVVKFRYSMQDADDLTITGIVFDTYLLNQEKWAKVLQLIDPQKTTEHLPKNVVYKISDKDEVKETSAKLRTDDFVGIVIDGSNIGKIKFEYSKKKDDLQEGDLLELTLGEKRLFYQVVNGNTEKEKLEARNETGFVEGEAIQLGEWNNTLSSFQKFGWVPTINIPLFKADTSDITVSQIQYPNYKLGVVPNTSLPLIVNLSDAVSHHMALLGVTGSGKSFLAREIIKEITNDTKVICVDFNKEFITTLSPVPSNIIDSARAQQISEKIDWIISELDKFPNQQDKLQIAHKEEEIREILEAEILGFIDSSSSNIRVFELPDVCNTAGILDYTKYFFRALFEVSKRKQLDGCPSKVCVVLEEAHTVVPEWNFTSSSDKTSQGLVNSIGQITLQGRKYGIGFLVIAQRTANVSKTVLTQCNTVVCFQAFDETSFNFLGNYVGKDLVQTLPNLKQYHAIVAGKAVKSNMPIISDLRRTT